MRLEQLSATPGVFISPAKPEMSQRCSKTKEISGGKKSTRKSSRNDERKNDRGREWPREGKRANGDPAAITSSDGPESDTKRRQQKQTGK